MTWQDDLISIVIPTYKRPDALLRVLRSVDGSSVDGYNLEIIIADNDPAASAQETAHDFMASSKTKTTYVHVPEPGVSNARNGALKTASGRYILFIDDDMEAGENWASSFVLGALHHDVTLAFGPIDAIMPDEKNPAFSYMQPIFSRHRDYETGRINEAIGTGNCFIDRKKAALPDPVFDPSLNQSGGEDNVLFAHLIEHGASIAWVAAAQTFEHVPAERATLNYVWRRNFAWGQGPTQDAWDKGIKGIPEILKWMVIGCLQSAIYSVQWLFSKIRKRPESVRHLGRLAQGVGKVLWSKRLAPKLYGL